MNCRTLTLIAMLLLLSPRTFAQEQPEQEKPEQAGETGSQAGEELESEPQQQSEPQDRDLAEEEAGPADSAEPEAGPADRAEPEAGPADRAEEEAGPADSAEPEAGPADRAEPEAGPADSAEPEAGPADRAEPEAGPADRAEHVEQIPSEPAVPEAQNEKPEAQNEKPEAQNEKPEPKKEGTVVILKRSSRKRLEREPFSFKGADTLDRRDHAIRASVGFPEMRAMYHMPWDTDIEFGLGAGFMYGFNAQTTGDIFGGMFMAEGRWRFYRDGDHSLAVVARPSFLLGGGHSDFVAGLTIGGPGLIYDYTLKGENHAVLGVTVPWGIYLSEVDGEAGFAARFPILLEAGMEFALTDLIHLFITMEMGVDTWTGDAPLPKGDGAYLFARGLAGAGFVL